MNTDKKAARIVGILFLLGFAGVFTAVFTKPLLNSADYLAQISKNETQWITGVFFQFVMAVACAGIGLFMYPVLKRYNSGLAIGAAGFRIIEATLQMIAAIFLFSLLPLSREFLKAGTPDTSWFQTLGELLKSGSDWVNNTVVLLFWCIGALMYYWVFYQNRLVPRWLSGWGLAAVSLCVISSLLVMFGAISPMGEIQVGMNGPIGLQELVLGAWLIVKGFNTTSIVGHNNK